MSRLERWRKFGPDARTFLAATIFVLVCVLCWGFIQRAQQADELIEQSKVSAQYVKDLRAYIVQQQTEFAERERAATRRSQAAQAERERLQRQLDQILAFLREQGLTAPTVAPTVQPRTAPMPERVAARHSQPRATTPRSSSTSPKPAPPASSPGLVEQLLGAVPSALSPGKAPKGQRSGIKPGQIKKGNR